MSDGLCTSTSARCSAKDSGIFGGLLLWKTNTFDEMGMAAFGEFLSSLPAPPKEEWKL